MTIGEVLDLAILAWLVYVDVRDRREKRVAAICPECLDEHFVRVASPMSENQQKRE